ncbi:MAG: SPOR domain-containing protein [Alphaproteobacteria bacterium]|nr:SPOR domain-containing protein [Alphaproteobacteria bacterium]
MDEFEKIRAFSEQMSQKTEEALRQENIQQTEDVQEENTQSNPDFLREWSNQESEPQPPQRKLNKAFWGVLTLATFIFIALLFVIYLLLKGPMDGNEQVPTISPTPTPVKVKPENAGGMVIPDQDKVIYERISQDPVPVKVEKLFPDEEPILPVVEEIIEEPVAEVEEEIPVIVETVIDAPVPEQKPVEPKKAEVKPTEPKKVEVKEAPKPATPKEVWHAQLFSSTDKAKVEKTWKTISAKHKGLLSDMPMNIVRAEIAGKGTFYRLQVGDFSTKERAANLCAKLKAQKQDCIPAK